MEKVQITLLPSLTVNLIFHYEYANLVIVLTVLDTLDRMAPHVLVKVYKLFLYVPFSLCTYETCQTSKTCSFVFLCNIFKV